MNSQLRKNIYPILFYLLVLLGGTFAPFHFDIPLFFKKKFVKSPEWNLKEGMVFKGVGMFSFPSMRIDIARKIKARRSFYIYLEVFPDLQDQDGPSRIFGYSRNHYHQNFIVGQSGEYLVFRIGRSKNQNNKRPVQFDFPKGIQAKKWNHILLTVNEKFIQGYNNGKKLGIFPTPKEFPQGWPNNHFLLAGNESTGERSFLGKIRRVVFGVGDAPRRLIKDSRVDLKDPIWVGAPDFFRNEDLLLEISAQDNIYPAGWRPVTEEIWPKRFPYPWDISFFSRKTRYKYQWVDFLINILMFIPLGWLLMRTGFSFIYSVFLCLCVSFFIEIIQIFLPHRVCSFTDFLLNGAGSAIGCSIQRVLEFKKRKSTNG